MIGDVIKANRIKNGWTQAELAGRLNVTKASVSKWELNQNSPDIGTLPALGDVFGISMDELLEYDRENRRPEEKIVYHATLKENGFRFDEVYKGVAETGGRVSVLSFCLAGAESGPEWMLTVDLQFQDKEILRQIQSLLSESEIEDVMERRFLDGKEKESFHLWVTKDEIFRFRPGDRKSIDAITERLIEKGLVSKGDI